MNSLKTIIVILILTIAIVIAGCFAAFTITNIILTGSPVSPTTVGSKLNPAPVNTTITYKPVTTIYIGTIRKHYHTSFYGSTINITLLEVIKGDEANRKMAEKGSRQMNPNNDFLMARFKVELIDSATNQTYLIGSYYFKASDSTGTILYDLRSYYIPYLDGELRKGDTAEGWVVLEYNKQDTAPMIVFDHTTDDSIGLWFKTTG